MTVSATDVTPTMSRNIPEYPRISQNIPEYPAPVSPAPSYVFMCVLGAFLPSLPGRCRDADLLIKTSPAIEYTDYRNETPESRRPRAIDTREDHVRFTPSAACRVSSFFFQSLFILHTIGSSPRDTRNGRLTIRTCEKMESWLAKDWYWVLVAFSLSIGIVWEDWLRTPSRHRLVSMGNMGKFSCNLYCRVCRRAATPPHTLHDVYVHPHAQYHPR